MGRAERAAELGRPGLWGGHGRGEDAQVWVSLGVWGLPCLAQKVAACPKSCAMGPLSLDDSEGTTVFLPGPGIARGSQSSQALLPLSCIPHPSVQMKWPRMTPRRSPWQLEESPGRTEPSRGGGPEARDTVGGQQ